MDNQEIRNKIFSAIHDAGYEYANSRYENWKDDFKDDIEDPDSFYYHSVDDRGFPFKEQLSEQISEETYHNYCNGTTFDFFAWYELDGMFSREEINLVDDDYLYDYLDAGITDFIKETYK